MTKEDKDLLLKDLCARLPYDVMVDYDSYIYIFNEIDPACKDIDCITVRIQDENRQYCAESVLIEEIKPFLRPMSSMTEEEIEELKKLSSGVVWRKDVLHNIVLDIWYNTDSIDWLNEKMFDYRGLIEKGLAIAVTEENNPYKN